MNNQKLGILGIILAGAFMPGCVDVGRHETFTGYYTEDGLATSECMPVELGYEKRGVYIHHITSGDEEINTHGTFIASYLTEDCSSEPMIIEYPAGLLTVRASLTVGHNLIEVEEGTSDIYVDETGIYTLDNGWIFDNEVGFSLSPLINGVLYDAIQYTDIFPEPEYEGE